MDTPVCECHGEPMGFNPDRRTKRGGTFFCPTRKRDRARQRYAEDSLDRCRKLMVNARWQRSRRVKHPAPHPKMASFLAVTRKG